jgi:hypothetical protein
MKSCQNIRAELSSYVDGELAPAVRAEIEAHLASCPLCQQELSELKTLAVGMAALPKLQPAPRFLADVRRKIARGDRPEPRTWQDHLFRPFWLKVPLEVAALVAIGVVVTRFEQEPVMVAEKEEPMEMAKAESTGSGHEESSLDKQLVADDAALKARAANEPERPPTAQPAPAAPTMDSLVRKESVAEVARSLEAQTAKDTTATPAEAAAPSGASAGDVSSSGARLKSDITTARPLGGLGFENRRRVPVSHGDRGELTLAPPPGPDVAGLARDLGIEPSKLGEMVVIDARNPSDVRAQAEELAERCHGSVIWAPDALGATGQVFFVELPQEYAATFKLELMRNSELAAKLGDTKIQTRSGVSSGAAPASAVGTGVVSGILIGGRSTNVNADTFPGLTLAEEVRTQETSTVVLQIMVVTPQH